MGHHHHHHSHTKLRGRRLLITTVLNLTITIVQIIGGLISGSLALLSDALHNLGDSSAIFIAFLAGKRSQKEANTRKTFGYKRVEILAALFNAVMLISICVYLFFEAYERFMNPQPIKGLLMLIVASVGLLGNLISVLILNRDKDQNLNVRAAYLHLMGDTLSSVAVIVGGVAIWLFEINWIDPLITVLVSIYIIYHSWGIVKSTVDILMQSVPDDIDVNVIKSKVDAFEEIENIHHLHVWQLDDTQYYLEAHINLEENMKMSEMMNVRSKIEIMLKKEFNISHITLMFGYKCCFGDQSLIKGCQHN